MNELIREKLRILKQLCIRLTPEQKRRISACTTEISLDNCARKIIVDTIEYGINAR